MNDDLKVEIPIRFKAGLESRFSTISLKSKSDEHREFSFFGKCPMCEDYMIKLFYVHDCGLCPFRRFEREGWKGCLMWLKEILGYYPHFTADTREELLHLSTELFEKVSFYIVWKEDK